VIQIHLLILETVSNGKKYYSDTYIKVLEKINGRLIETLYYDYLTFNRYGCYGRMNVIKQIIEQVTGLPIEEVVK